MARPLRYYTPGLVQEVTVRTIQGRHLLHPSRRMNRLLLGVIGRAQARYGVRIYDFVVMSNHIHMVISADTRRAMVGFMTYVNSNIARVVGRLRNWPERFWGRRYRSVPILDHDALLARLRYIFAHGYKEGLVGHPGEWRGAHAVGAWCHGKRLIGTWFDRTAWYRDRSAGLRRDPSHYQSEHEVVLSPPPGWEGLPQTELRARMKQLVREAIETHPPARPFRKKPKSRHARRRKDPHTPLPGWREALLQYVTRRGTTTVLRTSRRTRSSWRPFDAIASHPGVHGQRQRLRTVYPSATLPPFMPRADWLGRWINHVSCCPSTGPRTGLSTTAFSGVGVINSPGFSANHLVREP